MSLLLLAGFVFGATVAEGQGAAVPSYTRAQSALGAKVYAAQCAACHGDRLQGFSGPALAGSGFYTREMDMPLKGTFEYMAREMPIGRPGSLGREEYAGLMALILESNGYPPGDVPLDYETALHSSVPLYFHTP